MNIFLMAISQGCDIRYQFTSSLDFRVISEYNEFSDQFFTQPLISWRPNPDTIFYFGGNQNFVDEFVDYNSPNYRVNKSQLFMKFQYLNKVLVKINFRLFLWLKN